MAVKKSNEMKVTLWTDTIRADFSGAISACVIQAFGSIMAGKKNSAAENRELTLRIMQEQHEKLKAEGL